ncbi:MAG: family 16 glycosylhydrolase [bacterium]
MKNSIKIILSLSLVIIVVFTLQLSAKIYKGAEYRTKEAYVYGRFEVNFKPAYREGVVSSFFTYHDGSSGWNELDIEVIGRYDNVLQFNAITPGQKFHIKSNYVPFSPYEDFHTYAMEWTPDYVALFVDGEEVLRQTGEHVATLQYPSKIMMNIWNPEYTGWVGYWNDVFLPAHAYYDWVSYSSYTPGAGNTGTDNNFTNQWKDDFNSFDTNRWQKATHTFGGNMCDFIEDNAVFKDGKLILCLTDDTNTGYADNTAPDVLWARENYDKSVVVMFSEELDEVSSSNAANYIIPGVQITNAILNSDRKSVTLFTQNYNQDVPYNVIVQNIYDDAETPNKITTKAKTINQITPIEFPFKVNVGGNQFGDYLPDQLWSPEVEYGYWMGDVVHYPQNLIIQGTTDDQVFLDERKGLITYKVRVPNGRYKVNLLFADNANNSAGERIFDVIIENVVVKDNLDVYAEVGKNNAFNFETETDVNDGIIDIFFAEEKDSAFVNGIIVEQLTTGIKLNHNLLPGDFKLFQNYPNPFNGSTIIKYNISKRQDMRLKIFDILGNEIFFKSLGLVNPGENSFLWNGISNKGDSLSTGVYILTLIGENKTASQKLVYLK